MHRIVTAETTHPSSAAGAIPQWKTRADVAAALGVKVSYLTHVLYNRKPESYYKTWEIKKRSGGTRTIKAPQGGIYLMQRSLSEILRTVYAPKASVHGFVVGRSIASNAVPHVARRFVLNVDIKDFFPSINFGRVRGLFLAKPFSCPPEVANTLAQLCCVDGAVAVGAPTSPVLANMVCLRLDAELTRLAKSHGCYYTRYADDITFSTSKKYFPGVLCVRSASAAVQIGPDLEAVFERNGFAVNQQKTRLQTQRGRQIVTGLVVNERLNVKRAMVRDVRAMLHNWERLGEAKCQSEMAQKYKKDRHPKAQPEFRDVLRGKIAFLQEIRGTDDPVVNRFRVYFANMVAGMPMRSGIATTDIPRRRKLVDNNPVRLLHLSDFHFKETDSWDANVMLDRLTDAVKRVGALDFVVVTGDVAFSGKKSEYELARSWFAERLVPACGLSRTHVYFVPGNHDCERGKVGTMAQATQRHLAASASDDDMAAVLANQDERKVLFARLDNYFGFVEDFRGDAVCGAPWWVASVLCHGVNVRLAGVNSSWMSWENEEQGRLRLSLPQANALTKDHGDVNVALVHHPLSHINDSDRAAVRELLRWSHVVLHGHQHSEVAKHESEYGKDTVVLAAGSIYQGSQFTNGFQTVELFAGSRKCTVHPYRWNSDLRNWHRSRDVYPQEGEGGAPTYALAEKPVHR